MKISVVIPVYNVERYLARCLDSVLAAARQFLSAQEGGAVEIICVNDGSTDGSAAILDQYAQRARQADDSRLSWIALTKPNGGPGSARNAGLDRLTGDYVTFVDSDDWIPSQALSTFAAIADATKAALVVSDAFGRDADPSAGRLARVGVLPRWRILPSPRIAGKKVQYSPCNKLYRADLFRTRRYPDTAYEDFPVTTDILCAVGTFALVAAPLYVYCANAGAASQIRSPFTPRKLRDSIAVVRLVLETARRQTDPALRRFALRQAADGLSSTVGQVYKAKDASLRREFLVAHEALLTDYPELSGTLSLKAAYRLWRMKRAARAGEDTDCMRS